MTPAPETKHEKNTDKSKQDKDKQDKKKSNLGSLEEDDEFEEFRTQGMLHLLKKCFKKRFY